MNETIQNNIQARLFNWLSRKTTNSAVRRIGEIPLAIGSDVGLVRVDNQDRVAVLRLKLGEGHFCCVAALCDGMGGMDEGSLCASQAIASFFAACINYKDMYPRTRITHAAQKANQTVHSLYQGRGGATLSAVMFDSVGGIVGVNVGDSRIYAYQDNKLEQITVDDTMAGLFRKDIQQSNELLQYIGMGEGLEPHLIEIPSAYETLIITSDGAHYIDKNVMQMIIQSAKDPALSVRRIIEVSKWCGGRDNASVAAITPLLLQHPLLNDPGMIQLWDPFGDLQIVLPGLAGFNNKVNEPYRNLEPIEKEAAEKKRFVRSGKNAKTTKSKNAVPKQPRTIEDDADKERPQLKIYFNEESDKVNNG